MTRGGILLVTLGVVVAVGTGAAVGYVAADEPPVTTGLTADDLRDARQDGSSAGYQRGRAQGLLQGLRDGERRGFNEGRDYVLNGLAFARATYAVDFEDGPRGQRVMAALRMKTDLLYRCVYGEACEYESAYLVGD